MLGGKAATLAELSAAGFAVPPGIVVTASALDATDLPGRRLALPFPLCSSMEDAATCPQSIIDTDPSGSGLGIWVLVGTEPGKCIYEYAGGIV